MTIVPSIRTRRWVWLAATVALGALWVTSIRLYILWSSADERWRAGCGYGCAWIGWDPNNPGRNSRARVTFFSNAGWAVQWSPVWNRRVPGRIDSIRIPLWIPPAMSAALCAGAFWRVRRARGVGACPECGYSLAGLTGARCPECGAEDGGGRASGGFFGA